MTSGSWLFGRDCRGFGGDQVLLDLLERGDELLASARGVRPRVASFNVSRGACMHLLEDRLRLRREIELHGAPIERMRAPLDPAGALHAIDEPREGDRLDLEALGERRLRHAFAARQMHDRAPLRLREAERLQASVHAAAQQARDVGDERNPACDR